MQDPSSKTDSLIQTIIQKSSLKQDVYETTYEIFKEFKQVVKEIVDENAVKVLQADKRIIFEYHDRNEFEAEIKFSGDTLIFLMHTNIFEFSRDHEVMKTTYIKDNPDRSYCGMITIFNFLSDSFKYNRFNDLGYLIGRVFINHEKHYFIEGKKEVGQLFHNFASSMLEKSSIREIIESAMMYTINFDLLTPPYENMKEVTVSEMQSTLENMPIRTGKRLGYRFYADTDQPT